MTPEELDALEALAAAATPGPWEAGTAMCCPDMGWVDGPNRRVCPVLEPAKRTHTLDANDAEFIAGAREAVPALIAALREARARVDELLIYRAEWKAYCFTIEEAEARGFKRGVAAMRDAAVEWAWRNFVLGAMVDRGDLAATIRALPDPEDRL